MEQIKPQVTRLGWIGTGVMGASMAGHLMNAGFQLTVFNRTKSKAQPLIDRGAAWGATPYEVTAASDVVFTIVGMPGDVEEVYLHPSDGILAATAPGNVLVDMTTSPPSLAEQLYEIASRKGAHFVDAPVSGGDRGAREGTLSIMAGGDKSIIDALGPAWEAMGNKIVHQGGPGMGQHTKMVNQILFASSMIGVCEALLYGYRAGLNLTTVIQSVGSGAAGTWAINNLGPRIIVNDFEPGFFVEHFVKDIGLALDEAKRMRLSLPGLALAEQLYVGVIARGDGRCGTQALIDTLAAVSGLDWRNRITS